MKISCALIALAAVYCIATPFSSHAAPPELTLLQQQYEKAVAERVTAIHDAAVAKLNSSFVAGVDRGIAAARTAGDLPMAMALEEEKKRIAAKEAMPADDEKTPKPLKSLRPVYRKELAKLEAQSPPITLLFSHHSRQD